MGSPSVYLCSNKRYVTRSVARQLQELQDNPYSSSSAINILALPEDVLVRIFSFISSRELASVVSNVCRSWRRICADHSLWKSMRFTMCSFEVFPVQLFRLAPQLEHLDIDGDILSKFPPEAVDAMCTSSCRVPSIYMETGKGLTPAIIQLLRSQANCLESLTLKKSHASVDVVDEFWVVIGAMCKLTSLSIEDLSWSAPEFRSLGLLMHQAPLPAPRQPTLKTLTLHGKHGLGAVVESLVVHHAPTLVRVRLPLQMPSISNQEKLVAALGRCTNLEKLSTPVVGEMAPLLTCQALSSIRIQYRAAGAHGQDAHMGTDALAFLRHSTGLRSLEVVEMYGNARQLLLAVRNCGSELTRLSLDMRRVSGGWEVMTTMLRDLPSLEKLDLYRVPPKNVLDGITQGLVPRLTELRVMAGSCHRAHFPLSMQPELPEDTMCSLPNIRSLLTRVPLLHICGFQLTHVCRSGQHQCECLEKHTEIGVDIDVAHGVVFYGHSPTRQCDVCEKYKMDGLPRIRLVE